MDTERPDAQWTPPAPNRRVPVGAALPLPAGTPAAPALPSNRRRGRRLLLAGALVCTVLALLLAGLAVQQYRTDRAPRAVVGRYFAALAAGDAPAALATATGVQPGPYLTSTVLRQQLAIAAFADIVVGGTVVRGNRATTQVSYRLLFASGAKPVLDAVETVRSGSTWRLSRPATGINLSAISSGINRLVFAGRPLPSAHLQVFPGALPVTTDNPAVQPEGQPLVRLIDEGQATQLNAVLSPAAKQTLDRALTRALTACLSGASPDPTCPQPTGTRPVPGSLRGTENLTQSDPASAILDTAADGTIELTGTVSVRGSWKIWNFNNQMVTQSGMTDLAVQASASIADLNTVIWVRP